MLTKRHKQIDCNGFTLVELLVVIGIISVLISILLPALNRARDMAKTISCLSNMRQLGIGFQMYANQFQNSFPPYVDYAGPVGSNGQQAWWPALLWEYGFADANLFRCPSMYSNDDSFDYKTLNGQPKVLDNLTDWAWLYADYGYNYLWLGSHLRVGWGGNPSLQFAPIKRNQVRNPSSTILLCDTAYATRPNWGCCLAYDAGLYTYRPNARHNNRSAINILWADGHATTVGGVKDPMNPYPQITTYLVEDPSYWQSN